MKRLREDKIMISIVILLSILIAYCLTPPLLTESIYYDYAQQIQTVDFDNLNTANNESNEAHNKLYAISATCLEALPNSLAKRLKKKETYKKTQFNTFLAILFIIAYFSHFIISHFSVKGYGPFITLFRILKFIHQKDGKKQNSAFLEAKN